MTESEKADLLIEEFIKLFAWWVLVPMTGAGLVILLHCAWATFSL